ncbi:ABC transporter permease subunit [Actinomadura violacea]|uniref:ABC transporter permease subunit n=1 Tax=Actinomadura violacea TaxID=2819934 RepID=A0ABS3S2I6_9ACTN|nr:ABC transporter permease subunit [Actinomadura violacea]MBO2462758.1 ABC transporter permease subunit [Actinomadura violacea]
MIDAMAAEWRKLRSVRSTFAVLGVVAAFALLCVAWSLYAAHYWDGLSQARRATFRSAPPEQPLSIALPVCAVLLGALPTTSEYASGMIRTSLAATPRHPILFSAKAAVPGIAMFVAALASLAVGVLAGKAAADGRPIRAFDAPFLDHVPYLLAMAVTTAALTLMTAGLAAVLRSTAGTITTGMAVLFVVPPVANLLPDPWSERVWSVLPSGLADQMARPPGASSARDGLPPAASALLLAAYVVVALGVGARVFARRDA